MLAHDERPLADDERRELQDRLATLRQSRPTFARMFAISAVVCGVLAVLTRLASDAPTVVIVAFWSAIAIGMAVWTAHSLRTGTAVQEQLLERALAIGRVRELRIQAARVAEIEEYEDEGACYVFEFAEGASIVVSGQQFYATDTFPNADFSLIEVVGDDGVAVDELMRERGRRLEPVRRLPREIKDRVDIPEHLTELDVGVDDLEAELARRTDAGRR